MDWLDSIDVRTFDYDQYCKLFPCFQSSRAAWAILCFLKTGCKQKRKNSMQTDQLDRFVIESYAGTDDGRWKNYCAGLRFLRDSQMITEANGNIKITELFIQTASRLAKSTL